MDCPDLNPHDLPWQDFTDAVPDDGAIILCLFDNQAIACRCDMAGFYTLDGRLITDSLGYPLMPDGWLPYNNAGRKRRVS